MFSDFFTYGHVASTLSAAVGGIFFGWIIFRTRSWYVVKFFLWRMFHGEGCISDPSIKKYLGEQSSLMLFRFVVMDVETNRDANDLIEWSTAANLSLEVVGRAGDYFDPKRRCMREDKAKWIRADRIGFSIGLAVLSILLLLAFLSTATSQAILRFNVSTQWFLLGPDSARAFVIRSAERLDKAQCERSVEENAAKTGFVASDVASLCKFWQDPAKTNDYIEKTVHQQRIAGGCLLFVLALMSWRSWRGIGSTKAAKRLQDHLSASSLVVLQGENADEH